MQRRLRIALDQPNRRGREAHVEVLGHRPNDPHVKSVVVATKALTDQELGHQKLRSEAVGRTLWEFPDSTARLDIVRLSHQGLTSMALPMTYLMCQRETSPARVPIRLKGDLRTVSSTNDPCLAPVKMTVLDTRVLRPGDGL